MPTTLHSISSFFTNAVAMCVAAGTIKFYTGQIYGKLGVRNRITAVACARRLNLVSTD